MASDDTNTKHSRKKLRPPIEVDDFVKLLHYKPLCIIREDKLDRVSFVEFKRKDNKTATVEFGTRWQKTKNGFYFYYEIVDWNNYVEGTFVPLDSDRRKDVICQWPSTEEEYKKLAKNVDKSLRKLYSIKKERKGNKT